MPTLRVCIHTTVGAAGRPPRNEWGNMFPVHSKLRRNVQTILLFEQRDAPGCAKGAQEEGAAAQPKLRLCVALPHPQTQGDGAVERPGTLPLRLSTAQTNASQAGTPPGREAQPVARPHQPRAVALDPFFHLSVCVFVLLLHPGLMVALYDHVGRAGAGIPGHSTEPSEFTNLRSPGQIIPQSTYLFIRYLLLHFTSKLVDTCTGTVST